jgi:hypothetical protein
VGSTALGHDVYGTVYDHCRGTLEPACRSSTFFYRSSSATVFYWHLTETWGRGDLRPYLLTQIYPVFAIVVVILWLSPPTHTKTEKLYAAIAWYGGAKLYEFLDKPVYSFGQMLSGHA